jgi:hypothetical protein
LRRCAVAAAATAECHRWHLFFCLLSECSLHVAQNTSQGLVHHTTSQTVGRVIYTYVPA